MIDPLFLIVLEGPTTVFEDGYGQQEARRIAATDFYGDQVYPETGGEDAVKVHGSHGDVYIRSEDIMYVATLDDDEFRPLRTADEVADHVNREE